MATRSLGLDEVERFLTSRHGEAIADLELLHGGFWSAAFSYRVDHRALVLRVGQNREWFEMDRDAMAYDAPDLPVPEVLEVGDGLGGAYAISVRRGGRFLENVSPDEAEVVGPTLVRLLAALKAVPATSTPSKWRAWLMDGLVDHAHRHDAGWRAMLEADPGIDSLFRACESRIAELAAFCPERHDLVHGDLLHSNVLLNDDGTRVNAVFSWKCSTRGDFLYDTAWCTFWGAWHPGIAAADVFRRVLRNPWIATDSRALEDAATRHHCYELHIGATHLGWKAWVGDSEGLRAVAAHTAAILDRGPLLAEGSS